MARVVDLEAARRKRERARLCALSCDDCGATQIGTVITCVRSVRYPSCYSCGGRAMTEIDIDFELDQSVLAALEAEV